MPTIKKPSKAQVKPECNKDLDKVLTALSNGAKLVYDNIFGYGVEYPTGGYFKISKRIYEKLNS